MTVAEGHAIHPFEEVLAYETLWGLQGSTAKTLVNLFQRSAETPLPSVVYAQFASEHGSEVQPVREDVEQFFERFLEFARGSFSVSVLGTFQYPNRIRESEHWPLELFYYRGNLDLARHPSVSVVGARKASPEGRARAAKVAKLLVEHGYSVTSGLAAGVDAAAMRAAIEAGGDVIGVIGTPISESYPKENADLQEEVARNHLLISQVPFYRYSKQPFQTKKYYFPARNATMAALSEATVIVEASDTSGTLSQARACLNLGRKLFILNSCFEQPGLTWPHRFAEQGAVRVRDIADLLSHLPVVGADEDRDGETLDQD